MVYKRIMYLGYYLKGLDRERFMKFFNFTVKEKGASKVVLLTDILASSLKYNISILEYFQFNFYGLPEAERKKYAGTGFMYEYQLRMNPKNSRELLENKLHFLNHYSKFVNHGFSSLENLEKKAEIGESLLANPAGKIVLKGSSGQCGTGVEVRDSTDFTVTSLIKRLKETGNDLVEEYVVQHDELMRLSPSGLNTLRIITFLTDDNKVEYLGARLRITVDSPVDNMAAGNLAAPVNLRSGLVDGPAVYSDITKADEKIHPITKTAIVNFRIPFFKEALEMVEQAALLSEGNRSIGWDVAITNKGPELIEGNHNWCKLLWQLPVKKGLKNDLHIRT
jgi:hypothetical protein